MLVLLLNEIILSNHLHLVQCENILDFNVHADVSHRASILQHEREISLVQSKSQSLFCHRLLAGLQFLINQELYAQLVDTDF